MKNFKIFVFVVLVMTTIVVNKSMAACDCDANPSGQPDYCRNTCDWPGEPGDGGDGGTNTNGGSTNPDGPTNPGNGGSSGGGGGGNTQGNGGEGGNDGGCDPSKIYTLPGGGTGCCPGVLDENGQCRTELADLGINLNTTCLINGQCSMNVYKLLQIRKRNQNPTVMGLFQDITLASTTAILGTVLTVALVISGLYFAIASISGKDTKRSKTIIIDCFVGLLLVMGSYTIIRLIQFLATAGG